MIQTERKTYRQFIEEIRANRGLSTSDATIIRADAKAAEIDAQRNRTETVGATRDQTETFTRLLNELSQCLEDLLGPTTATGQMPLSTPPEFGSLHGPSGFG